MEATAESLMFGPKHSVTANGKISTIGLYRQRRAALIKLLGGHCVWCERAYKLEFHHVNERREGRFKGGWQALLRAEKDIREGKEIVLLCEDCHIECHRGESEEE
jgi:hypothetical protein